MIRGMNVQAAKAMLNEVIKQKRPVPYKRCNKNIGHRRGRIAAGRFPIKACTEIVKLIESAETNAQFRGLNTGSLVLRHISAQRAAGAWHYGRLRRRQMKRTHLEIIVEESAEKKAKPKNDEKPAESKPEKETQGEKKDASLTKSKPKKDLTKSKPKESKPKKETQHEASKKDKNQKESQEAKK